MRIIDKTGAQVRSLTAAEQVMLEGFALARLQGPQLLQANQWLMKLRAANHWLACDCQAALPPVLNVTLNGHTGTLFLKNNPGTPEHAANCPFTHQARDADSEAADSAAPVMWLPPDVPLRLLGDFRPAASGAGIGQPGGAARDKRQPLLSLLLTWIEASGLNVYATALKRSLTEQFAELRTVAARYPLVERVPASHYLETRIDMKHMMMLKSRLKDTAVFGNHRRYGLLLDCIAQVQARKVMNERSATGFDFQGHHLLWGGAHASGPLLAMAVYSPATAGSQFYEMINVATVPVLSRAQLFPVFRDEEREPLKVLISLIDWMASKGVAVTLRRPVIGGTAMDELVLTAPGDRVLSISLTHQPRGAEPSSDTFKRYADFKSIDTFRKFVAGFFMRERS